MLGNGEWGMGIFVYKLNGLSRRKDSKQQPYSPLPKKDYYL